MIRNSIFILILILVSGCFHKQEPVVAPWGEEIDTGNELTEDSQIEDADFDLDDIIHSGELIALTMSGPDTYYDYHGKVLGLHAMVCQHLADTLGVRLRMELCRDTTEMLKRISDGEADLIAYPLNNDSCVMGWRIAPGKEHLALFVKSWFRPSLTTIVREEQSQMLSKSNVRRKVYAPMLNQKGGIISRYDALFQQYAQTIHWDWRLLAAQCYQESTFDPNALSWAGAKGLMQIMPQTADHLGLPRNQMNQPEANIAAAVRYIDELENTFKDVADKRERQNFILAAYNGGAHHIRDAMALAKNNGHNHQRWDDVSVYVLQLQEPSGYQNPLVKYGYMRGIETVNYVSAIRKRYQQYRGVKSIISSSPQKSRNERHRSKYDI